ncbi:MAG: hypothetical protein IKX33_10815 [Prevotella sp.]|nr:hypothetical protein [Prevotella sp.]
MAHLVDIWKTGAPSIDILAPDIYDTGFKSWASHYAMPLRPQDGGKLKNRLFIPGSRCCENSGVRAIFLRRTSGTWLLTLRHRPSFSVGNGVGNTGL